MPGSAEFAPVEFRVLRFPIWSWSGWVENHPGDYEPRAVDIRAAELARRFRGMGVW